MSQRFAIFCFTDQGEQLARRIAGLLTVEAAKTDSPEAKDIIANSLSKQSDTASIHRVTKLSETVQPLFQTGRALVFIGASGIAVRAIAPLIRSKTTDPAVIVIDEAGRFVIPLLSGHLGRANRLASQIAALIDATPVITTATDVNGVFAFDAWASEYGYQVANPSTIKIVASAMLNGQTVGLSSDFAVSGDLPGLVEALDHGDLGVCISLDQTKHPFTETLKLVPTCVHIGIGSRKGVDVQLLKAFFFDTLANLAIPIQAVAAIASIDLKKNEPAINQLAESLAVPFITYSAAELNTVASLFEQSERVLAVTQTGNVCAAAAYLSSGQGRMVCPKTARDGCTIAIAISDWTVQF
ncbi:MAG: cobalt-precorrin 5A hydrolase [Coriobacteriales bacterium]|nr:cobalt-precorrin 5A hydrolase [Coriobacteriales bacterium]